ncbi:alpha/beta hydrolase [Streptomyces sp. NPDC001093]|uniref:alpha/beta hydrolase n=1 Tax=Streptomyces sp. NPDC001093 TaxID=3154376 RepID=UPI00331D0CB3
MSTIQMDKVTALLRGSPLDLAQDPLKMRPVYRAMLTAAPVPADVQTEPTVLGGVPALRVRIEGTVPTATIVHFHGGCYAVGSPETSLNLVANLARRTGAEVISVDYRLTPEHRYPAAVDDALTAYRALLDAGGDPLRIAVAGESAGAGLAMATLLAARRAGLPQPAAALLLSPWVDLTQSGRSLESKAEVDPSMTATALRVRAADYLGDADPRGELASPALADLRGLPPMLVQAGSHEVLLDDAVRLAARAAEGDVDVTLDVVAGAPHVFQAFAAVLDEAAAALDRAAAFLRDRLDPAASPTQVVA